MYYKFLQGGENDFAELRGYSSTSAKALQIIEHIL